MGAPLGIARTEYTSGDLQAIRGRSRDGAQVRRLLALALVLEGRQRSEAAALNGMDRQIPRDRVHRYNTDGVAGLKSHQSPSSAPASATERPPAQAGLMAMTTSSRCHLSKNCGARRRTLSAALLIAPEWSETFTNASTRRSLSDAH
jgi:hypothetical protein